eukprot:scaffold170784_cov26-Prasinocladus_malaysianus.AAC.1
MSYSSNAFQQCEAKINTPLSWTDKLAGLAGPDIHPKPTPNGIGHIYVFDDYLVMRLATQHTQQCRTSLIRADIWLCMGHTKLLISTT